MKRVGWLFATLIIGCQGGMVSTLTKPQSSEGPVSGCIDPGQCGDAPPEPSPAPETPPPEPQDCPPGEVLTYRYLTESSRTNRFQNRVEHGSGGASMTEACEPGTCGKGQVRVMVPKAESFASFVLDEEQTVSERCVDKPMECGEGSYETFIPPAHDSSATGSWHCAPPCELLVHYGSIFGYRTVCAGKPGDCSGNLVPRFSAESETWVCQPPCDNLEYDLVVYESEQMCVPC